MRIELETDRFYLGRDYSEAVEAAGGLPVHLSLIPRGEYLSEVVRGLDGILLPGSDSDVDPSRYGREPKPGLGHVHPIKDETDLLVLEEVERLGLPLLAICFGMQALNVSRGGTLIQDIRTELPEAIKHQQGAPRDRRSHRVRLLGGVFCRGWPPGRTRPSSTVITTRRLRRWAGNCWRRPGLRTGWWRLSKTRAATASCWVCSGTLRLAGAMTNSLVPSSAASWTRRAPTQAEGPSELSVMRIKNRFESDNACV